MVFAHQTGGYGGSLSPSSLPQYGSLTRGFSPWLSPAAAGVGNHAVYPLPDLGLSPDIDLMDELLDKRESILDEIPIVPEFDTLMGQFRKERAQLPTYEEVAAKRTPAMQAFHDKYSNKLGEMADKYGFELMAPGSLAAAKAGFEARKGAYEDIQRAKIDRAQEIREAKEQWEEEKSDLIEEYKQEREKKKQEAENFLNNLFQKQVTPQGFNHNLSPRAAYGKEGAPLVIPSDEKMEALFGPAPDDNNGGGDDDTGFLGDLWDAAKGMYENAAESTQSVYHALNPFDDVSAESAFIDYAKDATQNTDIQKARALGDSFSDSLTLGLTNLIPGSEDREKQLKQSLQQKGEDVGGLDMLGQALGFLVPGAGSLKAAKALGLGAKSLKGLSTAKKIGQLAKEGAASGAIFETALEGSQELQNPDEETFGNHLWDVTKATALGAAVDPALHGVASKLGNLWTRWRAGKVSPEAGSVELRDIVEHERQQLPKLDISEDTPFNTLAKPVDFGPLMDDLGSGRFRSPEISFNTLKHESSQAQEIDDTLGSLDEQFNDLQDAKVEEQMMPIIQKVMEWDALKELDDEYRMIRQNGKITIPEGNRSDWVDEVPLVFRAGKNNPTSTDLYSAAEQYGFDDVDDFVQHLQNLDDAHKIVTGSKGDFLGLAPEHRGRIENYEKELRQQWEQQNKITGVNYAVNRQDTDGAVLNAESKPQGLYVSIKRDGEVSPHIESAGDVSTTGQTNFQNPLRVEPVKVNHERFGPIAHLGPQEASAGISALKALLPEQQFNGLLSKSKQEMIDLLNKEFPGPDYLKYDDAYELLEVYAAQLARKEGYDGIILEGTDSPEFDEIVVLNNDSIIWDGDQPFNEAQGILSLADTLKKERAQLKPELSVEANAQQPRTDSLDSLFGYSRPKARTRTIEAKPLQGNDIVDHNKKAERVSDAVDSGLGRAWNQGIKKGSDASIYAKVIENALNKKGRFEKSGKLHQNLANAKGATASASHYLKRTLVPAFEQVDKSGRDLKDAINYAYAKHLLEVLAEKPNYRLPKGFTKENLQATVQKFQNDDVMNAFVKQLQEMQQGLLRVLRDSGYINEKQYRALLKRYPNYLPKFRVKDLADNNEFEDVMSKIFGKPSGKKNPIIQLEEGSGEMLQNFTDSIAKYASNVFHTSMKNKALQELENLKGKTLAGQTLVKEVEPPQSDNPNIIKVKMDGEEHYYSVQSDLMEAIEDLNGMYNPSEVADIAQRLAKLQSMSITANPVFATKNGLRDTLFSWVVGDFSFVKDLPAAAVDMLTDGKFLKNKSMIDEFYHRGAGQSTMAGLDRNGFYEMQKYYRKIKGSDNIKEWTEDKAKNLWGKVIEKYIRGYSEFTENLPKMAQYRASVRKGEKKLKKQNLPDDELQQKQGELRDQAAFTTRDLFDVAKQGTIVKSVNPYIRFLNATIRGREKFARSFVENPIPTSIKSLVAGSVPTGLAYLAYQSATDEQKQVIDEAPQWLEDTYWLVADPGGKGVWKIPKPFEVAAAVSSPLEWFIQHDREFGFNMEEEITSWVKNNILIDPTLNPAMPFIEALTGVDTFTGRSIVPRALQDKAPIEQQNVYTSSTAKGFASLMNQIPLVRKTKAASPMQVENFIEGFSPVTGEAVNDVIDRAMEEIGVRENKKPGKHSETVAGSIAKSPVGDIWKQFLVDSEGKTSTLVGNLYDTQTKLQNLRDKLRETDAKKYEHPRIYSVLNDFVQKDGSIAGQIDEIVNNPDYSPQKKEAFKNRLIEKRNEQVRQLAERGFFSSDPETLDQLEENLKGKVELDQDQVFTPEASQQVSLAKKLLEAGISKSQVKKIINADVSDDEKKRMILGLLQNR